jgi:UDP-2,3-diacylglucosamine pyrophosphatase LpxH
MMTLTDDTLVVFVSDSHIGGDEGRDIFESPDHLARLFDDVGAHPGPVELVLGGDFFDFLRMGRIANGTNRAAMTLARPEYQAMFAALARFAAGENHRVTYLPGNHDAELWWNPAIRAELERHGLVHAFALSYSAAFAAQPNRLIYCEHGNEFDPDNAIHDYNDPLDTPLGEHIVTEIVPRLPGGGWIAEALQLKEIERVFPLGVIPEWVAGRLFYALVTQAFVLLLLPLLVAYVGFEMISFAMGEGVRAINALFVKIAYDILLLVAVFSVFFLLARRIANRAIKTSPRRIPEAEQIRQRLEGGVAPPLAGKMDGEIAVFVYGHTHAPDLVEFASPQGKRGVIVNSGCWLRQLQSLRTYFGTPKVYLSRFVQTHVRVYLSGGALQVELWEHPRPSRPRLRIVERIAVLNWLPVQPEEAAAPRVRIAVRVG